MQAKKAGEIMIPLDRYPHIPHWFTLRQAIAELRASQIEVEGRKSLPRAVLVFSKAYELLGIVRRRDILRGLQPSILSSESVEYKRRLFEVETDPNLFGLTSEKLLGALREQAERPVSDIMLPITATVDYDDSILKVIHEMVKNDISFLPVLKDGGVVGVARSVDVLNEVADIVLG